jgi:hypothetical protein
MPGAQQENVMRIADVVDLPGSFVQSIPAVRAHMRGAVATGAR